MELANKPGENKVEVMDKSKELDALFDELLTTSHLTKELRLTPKITIKFKTLSTGEVLNAETLYVATLAGVPRDIVDRIRFVSILSYAVIEINGRNFTSEDHEEQTNLRNSLYTKLMELPPTIIDKIQREYYDLVAEQNKLYEEAAENIENF